MKRSTFSLTGFLRPPVFEGNSDKTQTAQLIHQIVVISWILPFLGVLVGLQNTELKPVIFPPSIAVAFVLSLLHILIHLGRIGTANIIFIGTLFILFTYLNYRSAGEVRPLLLLTALVVVITGLLLGSRGVALVSVLMALQNAVIVYMRTHGMIAVQENNPPLIQNILVISAGYLSIALLIRLAIKRLEVSLNQVRVREEELNLKNHELQHLSIQLEKRVAERTRALVASSEISRRLSSILDKRQLAIEVVEQLKAAFNYYHAHIYLMDNTGDQLVMTGGTGEVGKTLLSNSHKIRRGKGLVGRAAATKSTVLVTDTSKDPAWLPNPLLPETRSEISVPILGGEEVLGVLDVQNNLVDSLTEQDATLLRSIADQVSIALQNIAATEAVARRAEELQKVVKVGAATSTLAENERAMLIRIARLTQDQFGYDHVHIFTFNERSQMLEIEACSWPESMEQPGKHVDARVHISQEHIPAACAARTRSPFIMNNIQQSSNWQPDPLLPQTASEIAVPLMSGDTLIGILDVKSNRPEAFSEDDASILSILAVQVAVAMQNVRAFQKTRQQAKQEALVSSINQKIQSCTTVEDALKVTTRELGRALGSDYVSLRLGKPDNENI
ncbi:MAG TPA: GAF domain-containing protein [Anaerolineales bacterium]|nr:GAF domain-containing protein [Anaerolineales bacterium]HNN12061.1 GAF domain-containing protein [Anaerolineales bacterium]